MLKEQSINGLNEENITEGIIKEFTTLKDTNEVSSELVLMWAQTEATLWEQKEMPDNIRDARVCLSKKRQAEA